jgi:hypothetical protein
VARRTGAVRRAAGAHGRAHDPPRAAGPDAEIDLTGRVFAAEHGTLGIFAQMTLSKSGEPQSIWNKVK